LAEIPEPEALALAQPMLDESAVRAEAARAVIKIAANTPGTPEPAMASLKKVIAANMGAEVSQAAEAALKAIQARADFITSWQVAGPYRQAGKDFSALFDSAFPPEQELGNSAAGSGASPGQSGITWVSLPAGTDPSRPCVMDLLKALGGEQCVAYARTRVYCPHDQPALLELGTDDGVKVWISGKLVHANNVARPLQIDSDKVNLNLRAGWNPLLLKITQNNLGWEFCARIVAPDGSHLEGLRFAAAPQE
jgi:hypothetical protein